MSSYIMILARIHRIHDSLRFKLAEWILALILFAWGWILLLPYETFGNIPSLAGLARIAKENTWGEACLLLGGVRVAVLVVNGAWRRNAHARIVCAFLSCFVWFQISFGLYGTEFVSPGLAVYPILFFADMFVALRSTRDAREIDDAHRARQY